MANATWGIDFQHCAPPRFAMFFFVSGRADLVEEVRSVQGPLRGGDMASFDTSNSTAASTQGNGGSCQDPAGSVSDSFWSGDLPAHARLEEDFPDDVPAQNPDMAPVYHLRYVGSQLIGVDGGVHKIEASVGTVLKQYNDPSTYRNVLLELGEKEVVITSPNEEVLFRHSYPQISSCGRRVDCVRFLAYIAGETTCTIAKVSCHSGALRQHHVTQAVVGERQLF